MTKNLPLHVLHEAFNPKWVEFAGFNMPMSYGSQIDEHMFVRNFAGVFDISHMGVIDIKGDGAKPLLSYLLANDVNKLNVSRQALYSVMLDETAGIIDDLICYFISDKHYRLIVNAATFDKDLSWIKDINQKFQTQIIPLKNIATIAVQGPKAIDIVIKKMQAIFNIALPTLKRFCSFYNDEWFIGRTGYTGEDGVEIISSSENITKLFSTLIKNKVMPCGLAARDSLRLEAGLNLYGSDMTQDNNPFESNLSWTLKLKDSREFVGKEVLIQLKQQGHSKQLIGVILNVPGMLRANQVVNTNKGKGVITSASFSPILKKSIAFARVPQGADSNVTVCIRKKLCDAHLIKPPFYKKN